MTKKHIFLSYCGENRADVGALREELIAQGERVWWDGDILPGQDWRLAIRRALEAAYAVILCLSTEAVRRQRSGIYPEIADAIALLREYPPGSIFFLPVRLSECDVPKIEIDSTRTLDRLQYLDLFPPSSRTTNIKRLVRAIRLAPHHP